MAADGERIQAAAPHCTAPGDTVHAVSPIRGTGGIWSMMGLPLPFGAVQYSITRLVVIVQELFSVSKHHHQMRLL